MGLIRNMFETVGESISRSKEQKEQEKAFVRNSEGTKAICAFMANLFEKGNEGYIWVKQNRVGLYPIVNYNSVSLCYMQYGDGQSLSGIKPKDIEVVNYSFSEMCRWYGLDEGCGYKSLSSRIQLNVLANMINYEIGKLPHIKFNNGYLVKMFQ